MNSAEAIKLLRSGSSGVAEWNSWRRTTSKIEIPSLTLGDFKSAQLKAAYLANADLMGAQLRDASLSGADLSGTNLQEANLSGADLSHCNLRNASLIWSIASSANLKSSDLTWADLYATDLTGCDLTEAILTGTNMSAGSLRNANFTRAHSDNTVWSNVDLSESKGLHSVHHAGPSTVGVDTLFRSRGRIPEAFLRGCGVPQTFIDYLPTLIASMQPIQFYSCFISHSSKDNEFCRCLHSRMLHEDLRVWYDEDDMKAGRKLHDQITEAIRIYDKLLLVLSPDSMNSEWVKTEIYQARQKELRENRQVLFPIRLCDFETIKKWQCFDADTGKDLAREIREYYIPGDFQNWKDHDAFEAAFAKLLQDLRTSEPPTTRAHPTP